MRCYIYKSLKKEELYLYLREKDDFSELPETLLSSFGRLQFVMELQLTPDIKLARANVHKVMDSLNNKGFFIQMPPTIIPESVTRRQSKLH